MRYLQAVLLVMLMFFSSSAYGREVGSSKLIARTPVPGFPEGTVRIGNHILVSAPATNQFDPSVISEYKVDGTLVREYHLEGELQYVNGAPVPFGLAGLTKDAHLNVYVVSTALGIVKIKWWKLYEHDLCRLVFSEEVCSPILDNIQETYTSFPDLPRCADVGNEPPCSPTRSCENFTPFGLPCDPVYGRPAFPNDLAFGPDGELYVTDTMQATIWKIPYGGGTPEIFFQDERLDTVFGPNGIRVNRYTEELFFCVTGTFPSFSDYDAGRIYSLPLDNPQPEDLELFYEFEPVMFPLGPNGELLPTTPGPDGFSFTWSGDLIVVLAVTSEIVKINSSGALVATYTGPAVANDGGDDVPWANPATFAFYGQRIIFTNHALLQPFPELFVIADLYLGEFGMPLYLPW